MKAICKTCGKEFSIKLSDAKRGDGQHCSLECRWPSPEKQLQIKVKKDSSGCWLWLGRKRKGYGRIRIKGISISAHRIAYELLTGTLIPAGMCILHSCDNPSCINPEHLFLGTNRDNVQDKMNKGRLKASKGEAHGCAKLSEQDVLTIRTRFCAGEKKAAIARSFAITRTQAGNIIARKNWKHI